MKKVAATRGHSPSFEEAFFLAMRGWGAAAMNSWLQRAGVLANFYGFLLRLSHRDALASAEYTHFRSCEKNFAKKTRESAGSGCERPCRKISPRRRTAETSSGPRFHRRDAERAEKISADVMAERGGGALLAEALFYECHSGPVLLRTPFTSVILSTGTHFTNVILSAAGRFACKSAGGVEEPLRWSAAPWPLQGV